MPARKGRPLTGRVVQAPNGEWAASVPQAIGANRRATQRFATRTEADAWCALAVLALDSGAPLPGREALTVVGALGSSAIRGTALHHAGMTAQQVADDWITERYELAQRGDVERMDAVRGTVRLHVTPFLHTAMGATGGLTRGAYREYLANVMDGRTDVPGRRGRPLSGPRSADAFADIRRILDAVIEHGVQLRAWVLDFDPASVPTPKRHRDARHDVVADPLALDAVAAIAVHLHAVHQVVLWTLRILCVRLGEAYGIQVRDLAPLADGTGRGLIRLNTQGGRTIRQRDERGRIVSQASSARMKTAPSSRVQVVPAQLMALYQLVIEVFHTDPLTGDVDLHARLVPGLEARGESGQGGFRSALTAAASTAGVVRTLQSAFEDLVVGMPRPKDMRSSAVTDMAWGDVPELVRKRWAGHRAGKDVHHSHYIGDDPTMAGMALAAAYWETQIASHLPTGLCVPTSRRCTTGSQPALAADSSRIDAQLAEYGWLVAATDFADDDPLLTTDQAADVAAVSRGTMGRWLREGRIPARVGRPTGGQQGGHLVRTSDLIAFLEARDGTVTVTDLADELEIPYSRLYSWVRRCGIPTSPDGARGLAIEPDGEAAIRRMAEQDARLRAVGMTRADAAHTLGVSEATIVGRTRLRILEELPERASDGTAFVTRASVERVRRNPRLLRARPRRRRKADRS